MSNLSNVIAEKLRHQTSTLIGVFTKRLSSLKDHPETTALAKHVDGKVALETARSLIGEGEHQAVGIDGSMDYDERLEKWTQSGMAITSDACIALTTERTEDRGAYRTPMDDTYYAVFFNPQTGFLGLGAKTVGVHSVVVKIMWEEQVWRTQVKDEVVERTTTITETRTTTLTTPVTEVISTTTTEARTVSTTTTTTSTVVEERPAQRTKNISLLEYLLKR